FRYEAILFLIGLQRGQKNRGLRRQAREDLGTLPYRGLFIQDEKKRGSKVLLAHKSLISNHLVMDFYSPFFWFK
ncbi:MAG: hypothetical protein EBZ78_13675, partial [Verrucomicrobia bacterium]|nr:hypothetical protein [Verrucomicrobiota bacterium]